MIQPKDKLERNYRNFGIAILVILALFIGLGALAHFLDLGNTHSQGPSNAYISGVKTGKIIGWYIKSGLWFGNIFAFFAAMEKRHSLVKGILLSLTGWVYVVYYALTRKTVTLSI
jgi:hypothetical protein